MSTSQALYVRRSEIITLDAPPGEAFPLFGPVREAEWADGWAITVLHAETSLLEEEGAVFTTHLHGDAPTIWLITRYETAAHRIEYARITPGSRAARVLIACEAAVNGRTLARVTYEITALSEAGNRYVEGFTEAEYARMMAHWEQAINRRLRTGKVQSHHT